MFRVETLSDNSLIKQFVDGDQSALELLIRRHKNRVYTYIVLIVKNGISLCKLHHAAFDRFFIGIRPDYIIEVRRDVLQEEDGPMLRHGLQGMHNSRLIIPRQKELRPAPELLERRWNRFKAVA